MLSKTKLQKIERYWGHFVFDGLLTRVFLIFGIAVFVTGIVVPRTLSAVLMERVFPIWFGCLTLYVMSSYLLTLLVSFIRRDFLAALFYAAVLLFFGWIVRSVFSIGLKGVVGG